MVGVRGRATIQMFLLLKYIEFTSGCPTVNIGVNRSKNE